MSDPNANTKPAHATTWIMTIVIALAVYLLLYPIVFGLGMRQAMRGVSTASSTTKNTWVVVKTPIGTTTVTATTAGSRGVPTPWYVQAGIPYFMVARIPVLDRALVAYLNWWTERFT